MGPRGTKRKLDTNEGERQPTRRSARLAGVPPSTSLSPTVRTDLPPSPSRSAVEFQSQIDADPLAWLPKMHLAVAPPETIVAGVALTSPVLVTFEVSVAARDQSGDGPRAIDFNGCWAFLSLVAEDRKQVLAPPRKDLLEGTIADSIHELDSLQEGSSSQIIGYAAFKDLKISEPGKYCFGVNVVDVNDTISSTEVKVLKVIHSETFQVVNETQVQVAPPPAVLTRLREIGIEI